MQNGLQRFIIGQTFKIAPGILPSHHEGKFGFTVTGLEHSIDSNNRWETTVKSLFYVLEKTQAQAGTASTTPSSNVNQNNANQPVAKRVGGKTRIIEGVKYTNGEIPNDKLRYINNWKSYKGSIQSDNGRIRLYDKASRALDSLLAAAEVANIKFKINGAFRSYDDQVRVKEEKIKQGKPKDAATPGTSNHGFGLAVDFSQNGKQLTTAMPQYKWLKENAGKYGFKRLPWGTKPEGENWEAWHWEYQNV